MKISHKWLQSYFKKPLPSSDEIAKLLTFHIFEVEGVEKKTDDDILDIKVLPDRASYCLSHQGIARELAALLKDNEFTPRSCELDEESSDILPVNVSVEAGDFCDAYNALNILNCTKTTSPEWLVERLHSIGQKSINLFVDIANFVMFDIGQPMHVFDAEKVKGDIVVRYARNGEKITTLDGKDIILDSDIVVVADTVSPLAIAGVKGGKNAESTTATHHIIVEAAHFNGSAVRKTSQKTNIKTDSTKRFENNISKDLALCALKYFVTILKKEDPDVIVSHIASAGISQTKEIKIECLPSFIGEKLGKELPSDLIISLLKSASITARREGNMIAVYPSDERKDLNIPEDIVDEVGRLFGYENIEGVMPKMDADTSVNNDIAYRNIVRNFLKEKGFSEVQTYSLVKSGEVELANPLSEDKKFLRTDLQTQIEEKIKSNLYYADLLGLNKIKVFEFGRVWKNGREFVSLSVGIGYKKAEKGERVNDEIKIIRDELFAKLGLGNVQILCTIDDTGGIISKNNKQIGVTNNIEGLMEVDFDTLISDLPPLAENIPIEVNKVSKYKAPSPYPFMVRDVAVFVTGDKNNEEKVWEVIKRNSTDLLVRHELFDVFEKKNKETGEIEKTSFAWRLVFQSYEKTLTDVEIGKIMDSIYDALKGQGWEIR